MGDHHTTEKAVLLEKEFNKYCENVVFAILLLGMIGFLYIFNITFLESGYSMVLKQVIYFCWAFITFFLISYVPDRFLQAFIKNIHIVFLCNILLMIVAYITPLGAKINNAVRWIKLGPIYLQPSEFLKYTLILFIWWLYEFTSLQLVYKTVAAICSISLAAFLVGIGPDIGTMAQIFFLSLLIYFSLFPTKKTIVISLIVIIILAILGFVFYKFPHIKKRIDAFKNPQVDLRDKNYQAHQLKIAMYGTYIFGEGFGNGVQKLKYLPNAFNDFIVGIVVEELGIFGLISILFVFFYLLSNIILCIYSSSNRLCNILLLSFFLYNLFNLVINALVCIGFFPIKGIALPFISLGGSFVVANLIFLGLAIRLNRFKSVF